MTVKFSDSLTPLLVPIDQVTPHPDNPNKGDDDTVLESVIVNGFVTACTADARTGHMIAGHTRLRVLKKLGATHIPIIWQDWDEMDAKRYLVGDNASARKAVMDDAALLELLKELHDETPLGLTGTSITESEYEAMLLEDAIEAPPEGVGFGSNPAPAGLHQVIVEFQDDPDARDEAFADLAQRYDNVRTADL